MTGGVNSQHAWPDEGATRVPDLVYRDADLYEAEQKLTSAGPFGTISAWKSRFRQLAITSPVVLAIRRSSSCGPPRAASTRWSTAAPTRAR